ncbi:MAG: metallophosphoesterase family protein [Promethearchaeota archaeon]
MIGLYLKNYFSQMSKLKKIYWVFFVIYSPIITICIIIWFFSLHGTVGTFQTFIVYKLLVYIFIFCALIGPIMALFDMILSIISTTHHIPRRFVWLAFLFSLLIPVGFFGFTTISLSHPAGDKPPHLLLCDGTGKYGIPNLAVSFWTQQETKNILIWGNSSEIFIEEETSYKNSHVFLLNDLKPDTSYWYQINNVGENYTFTTPPATNDTITFAVATDSHFGPFSRNIEGTINLLNLISDPSSGNDAFFFLGDFVDLGFDDYEWKLGLDTFSPFTSKIPFRPVIGNHESILGGAQYFLDYFYPIGMTIQTGSRFWYRIDINNIHFFLLDLEWGIEEYNHAQKIWFEDQIKTIPKNDWTIFMCHCNFGQEMIDTFHSIFLQYDVDLVFSGHSHNYNLENRSGIIYTTVGVSGGTTIFDNWYDEMYCYMNVKIAGDTANLKYFNALNETIEELNVTR